MDSAQIWDRDSVIHLIDTSKAALAKALWTIYQRQTTDEQRDQATRVANGRGFNSRDAQFLSDVARKLPAYSFNLTDRQVAKVRPMMRKYWRQLLEEIELKGGTVTRSCNREIALAESSLNSERATIEAAPTFNRSNANPLFGAYAM
jgi:hypothetical protein